MVLAALSAGTALHGASPREVPGGTGQFSYTGTFTHDDETRTFYFTLSSPTSVTVRTFGFGGGTNAAGTVIAPGGFDPTVSLFDSAGNLIAANQDGGCPSVAVEAQTGFCWDSKMVVPLPAGSYQVVLTQSDNSANGPTLADSFVFAGEGNFTSGDDTRPGFYDDSGIQRTGAYAIDILGATNSVAQLLVSVQTPPGGKVATPYSYQFQGNGGTTPYTWTLSSGTLPPGLTLAANGTLSGTPILPFGTNTFTLQLADAETPVVSVTQQFSITIIPQDLAITSTALSNWVTGTAFTSPVGVIGGYPPYTWAFFGTPAPTAVNGVTVSSGGTLSGTPTATGSFTIPVQVTDNNGTVVQKTLTWQVNAPITITTSSLPPGIINRAYSSPLSSQGGATTPLAWSLVSGTLPSGISLTTLGVLTGTPTVAGQFPVTVRATDGVNPVTKSLTINVYPPLIINTDSLPPATVGQSYSASVVAAGGSGSATLSAGGLPANLTMGASGSITGTPTTGGTFTVSVSASDPTSGQFASKQLSLTVNYVDLTISTGGDLGGTAVGTPLARTFAATGGKPPFTWSASGLPATFSLDATGNLSGTPTAAGNFTFTAKVTDNQPVSTTATFSVQVLGITSVPQTGSASTVAPYSGSFGATGGAAPYVWSATGVPDGMALSSSGALSGTPKAAGKRSLSVRVTDSRNVSVTTSFSLDITAPPTLTISKGSLGTATKDMTYSDSLAAGGGVAPYTWTVEGGALPDGLSLGSDGSITGTPTKAGSYSFTAKVKDSSGATASSSFTLTVNPPALKLSIGTLPNGVVGSEYPEQIFSVTGGTKPYKFTLTSGSLPPGLGLSGSDLTGTPTEAGTYPFSIKVTDADGSTSVLATSILIKTANADLILSTTSVGFSLTTPATVLPGGTNVTIRSSVVQQILNYSITVTPSVPWLTVTSIGTTTPGSIGVQLNSAALSLPPSDTPYTTSVVVACVAPSLCKGNSQPVAVSLSVTAPDPKLSATTSLLSFSATTTDPSAPSRDFAVSNIGGGTLNISSIAPSDAWIKVSGAPASLKAGITANVTVGIDTTGLTPNYYQGKVTVTSSAGTASVPVTLNFVAPGTMDLAPGGTQFSMPAGSAPGNPSGSFLVLPHGKVSIGFTSSVTSSTGGAWLKVGSSSGAATVTNPGSVGYSVDSTVAGILDPGTYYATIQVSSPDVVDSPQTFTAVLNVTPATVLVRPDPQPAGFDYTTPVSSTTAKQTVTVYASSKTGIPYQASASTNDGASWLAVSPNSGTTSASSPAVTTVTISPAGLPVGTYRGGVSYAFSAAAVRTVNVTLIVRAGAAPSFQISDTAATEPRAVSGCTSSALIPTQTGLVNNFAQPTAWPTALSIKVSDNCGTAVPGGQVVATFSNGDPPLPLKPINDASGIYTGTWTPRSTSSQVTILARATVSGYPAATTQIQGQVTPNAAPVLTPDGSLHAFAPIVGGSVGPGSIIQIYGDNLAAQPTQSSTLPLPTNLGGTSVIIGGIPSPVYYVSPGQVNAQLPFELVAGRRYEIVISANGALSTPNGIQVTDTTPGVAAFANGLIIAQHLSGALVTEDAPAAPGEFIIFYLAGLGTLDSPVPSGNATPFDHLVHPVVPPSIAFNGKSAPVAFAGMTPGLVGLYQINFQIPADAPNGDLSMVISQLGNNSNRTIVPVKAPTN